MWNIIILSDDRVKHLRTAVAMSLGTLDTKMTQDHHSRLVCSDQDRSHEQFEMFRPDPVTVKRTSVIVDKNTSNIFNGVSFVS